MVRLSPRGQQILHAIVCDYLETVAPVSSKRLIERFDLGVSSATVRNAMAELEDAELLEQPHTSSGRIPTSKAYRYYVDHILTLRPLTSGELASVEAIVRETGDVSRLVRDSGRVLSVISRHTALVSAPSLASAVCEGIEFVRVASGKVLVLFVMSSKVLCSQVVEDEGEFTQEQLERFGRYLNPMLMGLTLNKVRDRIDTELDHERARFDEALAQALHLGATALAQEDAERELYVEGSVRFLDQPEFSDLAKTREVFRTLEEKRSVLRLLSAAMEGPGTQVLIGPELVVEEMHGCAVVVAQYAHAGRPLGSLGVIGPARMDYARVIPLVGYVAQVLSQQMERG
ncbi:MAG: heat-inducible transcription repressor HrcA [Myxococcales bacterium]|nr:heat-inducible transcription repressor HrcA [Myxococcales bacterium]